MGAFAKNIYLKLAPNGRVLALLPSQNLINNTKL